MRLIEHPRARTWFLTLSLLILFGGDAWRYSVGWVVWGAAAAGIVVTSVVILVQSRHRWSIGGLPYPFVVFMALATVSLAWSQYPAATALGLATTWMTVLGALTLAISFSWQELLDGLARVLRILIALSLLFELIIATIVRGPILPWTAQPAVAVPGYDTIPKMLYWSRNELFETFDSGRIQGIVGNANHLGFLALLGVIAFSIQWATGSVSKRWSITWIALAALTLFFTRSATVTVALAAVTLTALGLLIIRRRRTERARHRTAVGFVALAVAAAATAFALRDTIFGLLGKSSDLTGRAEIWQTVIGLAQQRPAFGWGWISFWMPWVEPFKDRVIRNGVVQLQAHDTWLDVWLQLGIVGVVVFAVFVASTLVRAWFTAIDPPQKVATGVEPYSPLSLLPILVMVALVVQSIPESRLIGEYALALLVIIAVKTKRPDWMVRSS
ncbi:O-antigen ligase family protein [Salinibacterium sp. NSLL150]|uniref:O-antigen ligase family protein n=1 Tax=unclassified Salinibacterium TaxID=2632331 RepID=UPI0018CDDE38|nr:MULTISPECIES: O-antigen ligase family protein [unclassified Salinibacterium]MBH0098527.1 O-antigen ligase family protein [Salinibacterium sp. NSLL35]MBH0101282.1 O-antigen ligase family protein [Salinibacterium sp. NSLL150]MBH0104041.1 O-antigen ligase family protein [Salinibacterium sp. NSLL16]MBH0106802.1 O-antigen ligase family protein [Salinibacterium sp. NSLL17]